MKSECAKRVWLIAIYIITQRIWRVLSGKMKTVLDHQLGSRIGFPMKLLLFLVSSLLLSISLLFPLPPPISSQSKKSEGEHSFITVTNIDISRFVNKRPRHLHLSAFLPFWRLFRLLDLLLTPSILYAFQILCLFF